MASTGINDEECKPGNSTPSGSKDTDDTEGDISGSTGVESDRFDIFLKWTLYDDEGVDGEGVIGYARGGKFVVSSIWGEISGLNGPVELSNSNDGEDRLAGKEESGVPVRDRKDNESSLSTLRTRVQMCFQMVSDNRGPGSSLSHSTFEASELGVGFTESRPGVDETKYRTTPTVLGRAYSFAIATS